jgi:hypothetical protein
MLLRMMLLGLASWQQQQQGRRQQMQQLQQHLLQKMLRSKQH